MFMTEQGAGSDVSATEVVAEARPDGSWRLSGDKRFCSTPTPASPWCWRAARRSPA